MAVLGVESNRNVRMSFYSKTFLCFFGVGVATNYNNQHQRYTDTPGRRESPAVFFFLCCFFFFFLLSPCFRFLSSNQWLKVCGFSFGKYSQECKWQPVFFCFLASVTVLMRRGLLLLPPRRLATFFQRNSNNANTIFPLRRQ